MFQLIVAVISIALIAALAIASIFYGGDAFTKSSEKANVTTLINQGQQIAGAAALYKTDNAGFPAAIADLNDTSAGAVTYLSNVPEGNKIAQGWTIEGSYAVIPFVAGASDETKTSTCAEVLKQKVGVCYTGTTYDVHVGDNTAAGFALAL